MLRLIGSSSSPKEKNWPELDVTLVAGAAGEERLTRSLWLLPPFPNPLLSKGTLDNWEERDVSESREPEPSLVKFE